MTIPFWIVAACALTMGIGTSFGGWRIIETVGLKMARITSWQGFAAQTSAASTIFGASHFGVPLSTTHAITLAIVGAGASVGTYDTMGRIAPHYTGLVRDVSVLHTDRIPCRNACEPVAGLGHFVSSAA